MGKLYMNKARRDAIFKVIPQQEKHRYAKSSIRNQLLHPMYVEDYELETGRHLTSADKGFGNDIYKTYFAVLYEIVEKRY